MFGVSSGLFVKNKIFTGWREGISVCFFVFIVFLPKLSEEMLYQNTWCKNITPIQVFPEISWVCGDFFRKGIIGHEHGL